MDNQRLFLSVVLGFILLMIWQAWQQQHAPPTPTSAPAPAQTADVPKAPDTPRSSTENKKAATSSPSTPPRGERIEIVTDLFQASVDTDGGDLRELGLRKHSVAADTLNLPFRLMRDDGEIFVAQSGLIGHREDFPNHKTRFTAVQKRYVLGDKDNKLRVPLSYQTRDGVRYTKTYIFQRDSYTVDIEFTVINGSKQGWSGYLYSQFQRSYVEAPGMFAVATYTGAALYSPEKKYEKISFDDMAKKPFSREVTGGWVAMLQHYFVGAWLPENIERTEFYAKKLEGDPYYRVGYKQLTPTTVAPNQSGVLSTRFYAGPKEQRRLHLLSCAEADLSKKSCSENDRTRAPGMELTVDYGWLTVLSAPLFWLLEWIHSFIGNWGWAIVVLTILIKLIFYPLSAMSYKSMAHMRRVQPKLEAIKKQHGHDRQQLNQAMMELYKVEKINPLGGCLPIVIQIPVFIALYWVLLESVEMRQAPWVLWIKDLSSQDPYYVLPIVMGATMYLQQLLSPQPPDPVQRKVFMIMPVAFTGMFIFFPAGLVLYWTVNNLLSIAQQWRINQVIGAKPKAS